MHYVGLLLGVLLLASGCQAISPQADHLLLNEQQVSLESLPQPVRDEISRRGVEEEILHIEQQDYSSGWRIYRLRLQGERTLQFTPSGEECFGGVI